MKTLKEGIGTAPLSLGVSKKCTLEISKVHPGWSKVHPHLPRGKPVFEKLSTFPTKYKGSPLCNIWEFLNISNEMQRVPPFVFSATLPKQETAPWRFSLKRCGYSMIVRSKSEIARNPRIGRKNTYHEA